MAKAWIVQGDMSFSRSARLGFVCLTSRGCLDGGESCLNLSLCSCAGFGLRYLIPLFVQAMFLAFDTGTFWDTILLWCFEIVAGDDNGWDENDLMGKMRWSRQHMAGEEMVRWRLVIGAYSCLY
jgi:hypothetical protein